MVFRVVDNDSFYHKSLVLSQNPRYYTYWLSWVYGLIDSLWVYAYFL